MAISVSIVPNSLTYFPCLSATSCRNPGAIEFAALSFAFSGLVFLFLGLSPVVLSSLSSLNWISGLLSVIFLTTCPPGVKMVLGCDVPAYISVELSKEYVGVLTPPLSLNGGPLTVESESDDILALASLSFHIVDCCLPFPPLGKGDLGLTGGFCLGGGWAPTPSSSSSSSSPMTTMLIPNQSS